MIKIEKNHHRQTVTYYGSPREGGDTRVVVVKYLRSRVKYVTIEIAGRKVFGGQMNNAQAKAVLWYNCCGAGEKLPKWL